MNLTQASRIARVSINVFFGTLLVYSIIYFSFPQITGLIANLFPKPEKPKLVYDKLPKIKFNQLQVAIDPSIKYELNTPDARLPNITPPLFNVYKVIPPKPSFIAGKRAQEKAALLSFTDNELASGLTGSVYRWIDTRFARNLEINISADGLEYSVNALKIRDYFTPNFNLRAENALIASKVSLEELGYFKDPLYIKRTKTKITYGRLGLDRVEETTTPQEYTFAKVDYFRTVFDIPIVGPRFDDGLLEVIVASPSELAKKEKGIKDPEVFGLAKVVAHETTIDTNEERIGRYPSMALEDAWKEVRENKGAFSKLKLKGGSDFEPYQPLTISKVSIEKVTIAYFDSWELQTVVQPIYVFQGTFTTSEGPSGEAVIYYPAVHPEYIAN